VKYTRSDDLELPLEILGDRFLLFKHFAQIAGHRERAPLSVLRLAGVESDLARAEVHH
jgi:hypothetical protein